MPNESPEIKLNFYWVDDLAYLFHKIILPAILLAIIITGHLWELPVEIRELLIGILGLCIDLKGK